MKSESLKPQDPVLIAHRGEASRYPENTLPALAAAADAGIRHLEFDVQLTADRVPVLSHDASLERTAGVDRLVSAALAAELTTISVGESERFGQQFSDVCLTPLSAALEGLAALPGLTLFVELKRHSLRAFGRRRVLSAVLPTLAQTRHRVVVISFDLPVLALARSQAGYPVGWVLSAFDEPSLGQARELSPEYVFCNHTRLPDHGVLPAGPWHWAVYEVTSVAQGTELMQRGVTHLESMRAGELLQRWQQPETSA